MQQARYFAYDGLTIRVTCTDRGHLTWLDDFLAPAFSITDAGVADCEVALDVDACAYDDMLRRGPHASGTSVDTFVLDNTLVRLPLWSAAPAECVVYDDGRVFYVASAGSTRIRVLTRTNDRAVRMPLMRVVREFAMAAVHASSRLVLHAAALTVAGTGVIIAGPKHAGKTSLLTHLLRQAGARFLSNDRVVVALGAGAPTMHAMPTVLTLRPASWALFPPLRDRLLQRHYQFRDSLREAAAGAPTPFQLAPDQPFNLTPAQYCALLDVAPVASGCPHVVLFPQVTDAPTTIEVRALSRDATTERLAGALFGSGSADALSELFTLPAHRVRTDRTHRVALCAALANQVQGFDCQLGRDAYHAAFPLDAIIHGETPRPRRHG